MEPQGLICAVGSEVEQLGRANLWSLAHFKGDSNDPWVLFAAWRPQATRRLLISWKPPPQDVIKLNTDASVSGRRVSGGGLLW